MKTTTVNLYSLNLSESRSILIATLFILGNIALPQLCHLIPQGGLMFLPIYFFTLIGAYKYGWQVGLLTAIASPLINSALFGMPAASVLPAILTKSVLLALGAAWIAHRFKTVNILLLLAVVLLYQILGSLIESLLIGSFSIGFQDFRIGIPGMLLQIVGGYLLIKYIIKK